MSVIAIALKDLRLLFRDPAALVFFALVPVVVVGIVAAVRGGSGSIVLPVADDDRGPVAQILIEALQSRVEVELVAAEVAERRVADEASAAAALLIPPHTSKRYLGRLPSTLTLLTDPAKGSEVNVVKAQLLLADRDAAREADPLHEELLVLEERNVTGRRLTTTSFEQNIPGFSVMFVLMGLLFGVCFGLHDERDWGTLTRIEIAPVGRSAFLSGKLLARFALAELQLLLLFGFGHLAFGLSLGPSMATFIAVGLAIVFCFTGFSLLVAAFARTREQVIPLGLTVVMVVCSIGGCWWPLFLEPPWLQQLAHLTPTAWAMDGLSDLILRERSFAAVAPELAVLLSYGSACLLLGAWLQYERGIR